MNIKTIIRQRQVTHGNFVSQAAFAQKLKMMFQDQPRASTLQPYQVEALEMIATKISRLLHGDSQHVDSWDDIASYAQLGRPQR